MSNLKENILKVRERINKAAERSGRKGEDIKLVAVTKTIGIDSINEAISNGITDVGENKVQELLSKYEKINNINWHFIGHLQTNKVKYIIDKVCLIHSVDSLKLAKEIQKRAARINKNINILLQVNISGEKSKFGMNTKECEDLLYQVLRMENINVKGLMTIAPYVENSENVRKYFRDLREFSVKLLKKDVDKLDMEYLSMGMSGDFEVAIEEGANIVRIGSAIFGKRNYV